jgi:hypothetical protein
VKINRTILRKIILQEIKRNLREDFKPDEQDALLQQQFDDDAVGELAAMGNPGFELSDEDFSANSIAEELKEILKNQFSFFFEGIAVDPRLEPGFENTGHLIDAQKLGNGQLRDVQNFYQNAIVYKTNAIVNDHKFDSTEGYDGRKLFLVFPYLRFQLGESRYYGEIENIFSKQLKIYDKETSLIKPSELLSPDSKSGFIAAHYKYSDDGEEAKKAGERDLHEYSSSIGATFAIQIDNAADLVALLDVFEITKFK